MIKTKKVSVLRIRLSNEEREAVVGAAGSSVSGWARTVLLQAAKDVPAQGQPNSEAPTS